MVSLSCGHCYCYNCQFRPPLLKIQCRQCRERTGLVIENQLRLLVQCYKHMCHVLAAHMKQTQPEPSKNDASIPETDAEVKVGKLDSTAAKTEAVTKEDTDPTSSKAAGTEPTDTEAGSCDSLVGSEGKEKQSAPVVTELDPIGQILREVKSGEKVSRAVLMIKPPAKYLNVRVSTPKKDHSSHPQKIATTSLSVALSKSTKLHSISGSPENDTLSANMADEVLTQSETLSAAKSASKSKKSKKPLKLHQADSDPPRQISSSQSVLDRKMVRVQHATLKKHKKEVNPIDISYPDNEITKAKLSDIFLPLEDWQVKSSCLDEDHVVVTSSGIEMNNNAPPLVQPSPSTPEPPWIRAGFKRSRSPLSPRLYDTKRRKVRMIVKRQQCSTASPGSAVTNVVMEEQQHLGKEEQSFAETPKFDSAGLTLVQSGGEVTPSPVKQRRKTPSGAPRCRCGTNHPQVLQKICARGKCPCFSQGKPCNRCLCRNCHNPYQIQ